MDGCGLPVDSEYWCSYRAPPFVLAVYMPDTYTDTPFLALLFSVARVPATFESLTSTSEDARDFPSGEKDVRGNECDYYSLR